MSNREIREQLTSAQARILELEAALTAKTNELAAAQTAAVVVAPMSKSKEQALAAQKLLEAGTVTLVQLAGINAKYPSDPIYYARTVLGLKVTTHKVKGGKTTYSLTVQPTQEAPAPAAPEVAPEAPAVAEVPAPEAEVVVEQTPEVVVEGELAAV